MKDFKAGNYISQGGYKSFQPNAINRNWAFDDIEIAHLLSLADRQLGRLDMHSEYIPNIDLFIRMHVVKEATQSSKIEGTQTNMEDALKNKEEIPLDKRDDWDEVRNYVQALNEAIDQLEELPISTRLVRQTHSTLLQGVRGEHKQPGELRKSQNWIGGNSIADAIFIPPAHYEVPELMSDMEKFIHNEDILLPDLLKIAIIHYQFETIHPFLDGNGRVGRLLITLYLVGKGILKRPVLYLSEYLEKNRSEYYNHLTSVRENDDIGQWCKFFLRGIIETSKQGVSTLNGVMQLKEDTDKKLQKLGSRATNARILLTEIYKKPLINATEAASAINSSPATAYSLIHQLEKLGILTEITGAQRSRLYVFKDYLSLFQ